MQWLVVKMRKIIIFSAVIIELVFLHVVLLLIARNFLYEEKIFAPAPDKTTGQEHRNQHQVRPTVHIVHCGQEQITRQE